MARTDWGKVDRNLRIATVNVGIATALLVVAVIVRIVKAG